MNCEDSKLYLSSFFFFATYLYNGIFRDSLKYPHQWMLEGSVSFQNGYVMNSGGDVAATFYNSRLHYNNLYLT